MQAARRFVPFLLFFILAVTIAHARETEKTGVLLVAFGTSVPEAKKAFDNIDAAYKKAFPGSPIVWAFTSQIIRKKLAAEGERVYSISEALDRLAKDGATVVRVQSLHVLAGQEFAEMARSVLLETKKYPDRFKAVYLGRPLLESREDANSVARALSSELADKRESGDAVALMGHGNAAGRGDLVLEGARAALKNADPAFHVASVEGARGFDEELAELKKSGAKTVLLAPFMVVAGDHARNDLAGEEDESWASRLKKAGFKVKTSLKGLGEMNPVVDIFIRHTRESKDNLALEPRKP